MKPMKRQVTISSYFAPKKTVRTEPEIKHTGTKENSKAEMGEQDYDEMCKSLHVRFAEKPDAIQQPKQKKKKQLVGPNYSPLELQVLDLKNRYPDCILLVEVGYKYKAFGEDAQCASDVLEISCHEDRNFSSITIATQRITETIQKLVDAGHKVGVVRQTETPALKAIGLNRNQPFERKLSQMYTKGTMVDNMCESFLADSSGYLLCFIEEMRGGSASDENIFAGIVAVQTSTGDIIYDTFEDKFMRRELETRLMHIQPNEILVPESLSAPTEKVMNYMEDEQRLSRIEKMPLDDRFCKSYSASLAYVTEFYSERERKNMLPKIMSLPHIIIKVIAALIRYLKDFNLANVFDSSKYITNFVSRSHMLLNSNALINLEIYRNNTNMRVEGSLFSFLDYTSTRFGQRTLRKWIGKPLVDIEKLKERSNAVHELVVTKNVKKFKLLHSLKNLPDLEKGLSRIHYGRATPTELTEFLKAMASISELFLNDREAKFNSELLNRLFDTLPSVHRCTSRYQDLIDFSQVAYKASFLKSKDKWPDISRETKNIEYYEDLLYQYLEDLKSTTQLKSLRFVEVSGIEFLLEVDQNEIELVPGSWIKINGTKLSSRFHTSFILPTLKKREEHRERRNMIADEAFSDLLGEVSQYYEEFRDVITSLAQIDCLFSLMKVSNDPTYSKPVFTDKKTMEIVNGRHPVIEKRLDRYVPNNTYFTNNQNTIVLTGPNMGGKSSYVRQIALICIMGQIGCYVPAESATLCVLDGVYTRMGTFDNMMKGESTLMVELHETSDIIKLATNRSLVILDELGRGTSTYDGQAIAYAVLQHFVQKIQPITIFITHYPSIPRLAKAFPNNINSYYMDYMEQKGSEEEIPTLVFLYKVRRGTSPNSYGMNVARLAGIPSNIIKKAYSISQTAQKEEIERKQKRKLIIYLKTALKGQE